MAALCLGLWGGGGTTLAAGTMPGLSEWARGGHSAVRLIALGPSTAGGGERQAALEIRLDPGYLTYWRQPGEAGLPPTIDTAASENIAAVAVDFPAPGVFDEGGTILFGYRGAVTLPLRVMLKDPSRPATLAVDLDYAVCAAICLPGKATLRLALPTTTDTEAAALVTAATAMVPRPQVLGAAGALSVTGVERDAAAAKPTLRIAVKAAAPARLFVEAPDGWFLEPGPPTTRDDGEQVFPVTVGERPSDAGDAPIPLRLTLADPSGAIDVPVRVDAADLKP